MTGTTSAAAFTPGSGGEVATYAIVENDGAGNITKQVERVSLNKSDGSEIDFSAAAPVTQSGPWNVGGYTVTPAVTMTRPADTNVYASGDLMANSTSAVAVTVGNGGVLQWTVGRFNGSSGLVRRARLVKSTTVSTLATFRLHLYATDPSASSGIANGDNGVWSTNRSNYLGSFDLDMTGANARTFRDGMEVIASPAVGADISFVCGVAAQTIFGLLEARAAYVPGSAEAFTVELEVVQN